MYWTERKGEGTTQSWGLVLPPSHPLTPDSSVGRSGTCKQRPQTGPAAPSSATLVLDHPGLWENPVTPHLGLHVEAPLLSLLPCVPQLCSDPVGVYRHPPALDAGSSLPIPEWGYWRLARMSALPVTGGVLLLCLWGSTFPHINPKRSSPGLVLSSLL